MFASPAAQRSAILLMLLAAAAASWILLLRETLGGFAGMTMPGPTMGLGALAFLAVWLVMMVAMMFPTAAPMVLTFHSIQSGRRKRGETFVPIWLFVAGYLVVWGIAGGAAYLLGIAAEAAAVSLNLSAFETGRIGGALLIAAGVYQLTPLKNACLAKCRSPIGFVIGEWREGMGGALRMGILHGGYCLGCCWLLFAILFPLGIMNLAAMALLTLVIFAEKSLPWGRTTVNATAAALVVYGAVVIVVPQALPGFAATARAMDAPAGMGTNMPAEPMSMPGIEAPRAGGPSERH